MTAGEPDDTAPTMIDIDVEPVIGKKGDYIAHAVPPPELTLAQFDRPDAPRSKP